MMTALAGAAGLVTVLYAISALGRLAPVKRRHHSWKQVTGMSAATLLVAALAGSIYVMARPAPPAAAAAAAAPAAAGRPALAGSAAAMPLGVYAPGEWKTWAPVQRFSHDAGQPVRYALDYLGPNEPFPARFATLAAQHGAEPVLHMNPAMTMAAIAAGHDDPYLRALARQVSGYRHPVVLSFAPEANGTWYPWGWARTPPAQYQAAWKHVMAQFTTARNVTWMDTVNVSYPGSGPIAGYIVPGAMIGIDGYYGFGNQGMDFNTVITPTLRQVRAHTSAPVIISETAIAGSRDQAARIPDLIAGATRNHLAGVIWFNQDKGPRQHWTLTPAGATALRHSLAAAASPRPAAIPVLLYHGIYRASDTESTSVRLTAFRQQMAYLHQNGYQSISPRQYQLWAEGQPVGLPARPVLITVDDGQASFLQALPVLRQYHYRAAMYIVTGFANGGYKGPEGQPGYYLSWAALKAMDKAGYIYPQFHAGLCGHGYTMASSPYACDDGLTPTLGQIWGHRYYSDPMGQSQGAYRARVKSDVQAGMSAMTAELGLSRAELSQTFAVPFSDYGQPQTTNQPWLGRYLAQQFSVVFVQDNYVRGTGRLSYRQQVNVFTTTRQFTAALRSSGSPAAE